MGYEKGSLIYYNEKFWLFEGYSSNKEHYATYKLRGVGGELIEALASECDYLTSPSEVKFIRESEEEN